MQPEDAERFEAALARARRLDTGGVRRLLDRPGGPYAWPRYRINEVELEWRRWRLRCDLNAGGDPPGSVKVFERLCVAAGLPPAAGPDQPAGPLTRLSYDEMFPQGAVIAKALRDRVVRRPSADPSAGPAADAGADPAAERILASTRRRRDYLRKLDGDRFWWVVPDLVSEATRRACAREAGSLPPGAGAAYDGGPSPGWDAAHDALVSRSCNAYLGAGPILTAIHEDPALVATISERMGRRMYPTRCTYLRYRAGDFLGVHTDQPTCEVSLMFTVDGEPGPLRSYLDRAGHDPAALHRWVHQHGNFPDGGLDVCYRSREGFALTGRAVPHARLPQADRAIVGALFFSGLV